MPKRKVPISRYSKLDKVTVDALADMVRRGIPKSVAVESLGVDKTTMYKWLAAAREIETPRTENEKLLVYLLNEMNKARAEFCKIASAQMQLAGKDDWRMWAFRLERQYPDEFGERRDISIDIKGSPARQVLDKVNELGLTEDGLDIPPVPPVPSSSPRRRGGK